jgi:hypothetical protein
MSNICKTVTLRTRKIKGGEQLSFYLDYYPGYRDESTMKVMRHESLGIYIYAKPKSQREKDYIQPDTGSIVIDEPDKGDYHFHFE